MVLERLCFLLIFTSAVLAYSKQSLYRYGYGLDQQLPRQDEISSPEFPLTVPIVFYREIYSSIFVNANGLLSFQTEIPTFFNIQFPVGYPIIAPLYSDVDIRPSGTISYRETQDPEILSRISNTIREHFVQARDFNSKSVFIATWSDVGYHDNKADKVNTYQVAIATDGEDSYVEFIYPEDGIQWIQGTGGESGLPDARAQAGLESAERVLFTLSGSGTEKVRNLMRRSNMNSPGQWLYHVGKVDVVEEPDSYNELDSSQEGDLQTCVEASSQCHTKAKCIDYPEGFCCVCQDGYYGNGKSCLKNDVPLRVNGKVNGVLNAVQLEQLDLQSYIVMSDGRAYTAISKVPREIGYSVQTLQVLGGLIGFLFAKPIGEMKNGYQLTGGVFNHTADINFRTGERVKITHTYSGLDVFDQLRLEANIHGNAPVLDQNVKLVLPDYEEQYTITSPGVVLSQSSHYFKNSDTEEEYHYTISQSIEYTPCKYSSTPSNPSWKLKVSKNFIGYENVEQIIRFGMSNKVGPLGDIDPCKEGRQQCGVDSSCIVEGDSFRCVCNPGYQYIYNDENVGICMDINECQVGLHNCDVNAQCHNEAGRFSCSCKPGFEGDGHSCRNIKTCAEIQCGENAQCVEEEEARCVCIPGYKGDGKICVADKRQSCEVVNNCSPYGACVLNEATRQYGCTCLSGFEGNGYICEPAAVTTTTTEEPVETVTDRAVEQCLLGICWCPEGFEKDKGTIYCYKKIEQTVTTEEPPEEVKSQPIPQCLDRYTCICPQGYSFDTNRHICTPTPGVRFDTMGPTGRNLPCNINFNCHPRAQCLYFRDEGVYECQCDHYLEGDGYNCNLEQGVNCTEHSICDINATCYYHPDAEEHFCRCNHGFKGDGIICVPADCSTEEICTDSEECVYSHSEQRSKCQCKEGFNRDPEGTCYRDTETWCGAAKCKEHASCLYDEEYKVHYCQCNPGYIGEGIFKCEPKPKGCDELNNCGLHASCVYEQNSGLYECQCNDGFYGDGFLCSSQRTCQTDPYMCDEHASCIVNSDRQYVCECNLGYSGNGTVCRQSPKHEGNFLLLNQGMATLRVPMKPTPKNLGRPIQIQYYQMAIGLDIDCYEGKVFWSDITGKAIKSSAYNGTNYADFLVSDIGSPEGLSIDWVSRNIYWTDSSKDTLEVANLDTKLRKVLFSDNLVNPRGIAVHPQRGKVFWSDWNRRSPKIEWANMDGTGREIFLHGAAVQLPNSLAIDWETDQLCYADAGTKNIECVEIDTRSIRTIAINCTYPFGLAISDHRFYWTDWVSQKIESVDKTTLVRQPPITVPLGGSGNKLYGMAAVPEQCPGLSNVCQFYNGQCSPGRLCLPSGVGTRSCVCAAPDLCNDLL